MSIKKLVDRIKFWQENPEKTVFSSRNKKILAGDFISDIRSLVVQWQDKKNRRLALIIEDSYLFSCAWLACQVLGNRVVMLPNAQGGTKTVLSAYYDEIIADEDVVFSAEKIKCLEVNDGAEVVFFTSGSTGKHQAYMRTLTGLETECFAIDRCLNKFLIEDVIVYATVSHNHLYGFSWYFLWGLLSGNVLNTQRIITPEVVTEILAEDNTLMITTPVIISHLEKPKRKAKNMLVLSSASELKHADALQFYEYYQQNVLEAYGSTETGVIAFRQQLAQAKWQCFENVEIEIDSEQKLIIKSPFFEAEQQQMSDKVDIDEEGLFSLLGRVDRTIKLVGKRVSLAEMEKHLNANEWVYDSACIVRHTYRESIVAMLQLSDVGKIQLERLGKRYFSQQLKAYLLNYYENVVLPKQWRFVSQIPVNLQGKRVIAEILREFD